MQGSIAGWHLLMDAIVEDNSKLDDKEFLNAFFYDFVEHLNMEILIPPTFGIIPTNLKNLDNDHDDGGISGVCVITTSHISIHTWPLRNKFSLDAYSCKIFNKHQTIDFIKNRLNIKSVNYQWRIRYWPS